MHSPGRDTGRHDRTREVWQKRCPRPLTDHDCHEIETNMTAFFRLLLDWDSRRKQAPAIPEGAGRVGDGAPNDIASNSEPGGTG